MARATERQRDRALGEHLRASGPLGAGMRICVGIATEQVADAVHTGEVAASVGDRALADGQAATLRAQLHAHALAVAATDRAVAVRRLVDRRPPLHLERHLAGQVRRLGGQHYGCHCDQRRSHDPFTHFHCCNSLRLPVMPDHSLWQESGERVFYGICTPANLATPDTATAGRPLSPRCPAIPAPLPVRGFFCPFNLTRNSPKPARDALSWLQRRLWRFLCPAPICCYSWITSTCNAQARVQPSPWHDDLRPGWTHFMWPICPPQPSASRKPCRSNWKKRAVVAPKPSCMVMPGAHCFHPRVCPAYGALPRATACRRFARLPLATICWSWNAASSAAMRRSVSARSRAVCSAPAARCWSCPTRSPSTKSAHACWWPGTVAANRPLQWPFPRRCCARPPKSSCWTAAACCPKTPSPYSRHRACPIGCNAVVSVPTSRCSIPVRRTLQDHCCWRLRTRGMPI